MKSISKITLIFLTLCVATLPVVFGGCANSSSESSSLPKGISEQIIESATSEQSNESVILDTSEPQQSTEEWTIVDNTKTLWESKELPYFKTTVADEAKHQYLAECWLPYEEGKVYGGVAFEIVDSDGNVVAQKKNSGRILNIQEMAQNWGSHNSIVDYRKFCYIHWYFTTDGERFDSIINDKTTIDDIDNNFSIRYNLVYAYEEEDYDNGFKISSVVEKKYSDGSKKIMGTIHSEKEIRELYAAFYDKDGKFLCCQIALIQDDKFVFSGLGDNMASYKIWAWTH